MTSKRLVRSYPQQSQPSEYIDFDEYQDLLDRVQDRVAIEMSSALPGFPAAGIPLVAADLGPGVGPAASVHRPARHRGR